MVVILPSLHEDTELMPERLLAQSLACGKSSTSLDWEERLVLSGEVSEVFPG